MAGFCPGHCGAHHAPFCPSFLKGDWIRSDPVPAHRAARGRLLRSGPSFPLALCSVEVLPAPQHLPACLPTYSVMGGASLGSRSNRKHLEGPSLRQSVSVGIQVLLGHDASLSRFDPNSQLSCGPWSTVWTLVSA